ncbi:hypothetical protein LPTSP3_g31550 [Leptospira kobayashii]|uniref:NERD domain-containing protein n=1 Tax=Leptospira kobayashii TaxID=1917830 RepID=A0ABM7UTG9_9LEPT|nr:hypothetical protein [Leptospira kobayashii]BDA80225.1 hypothetical protein LPTSP3_g31550 [Leptospira kobayashii]
MVNIKFVDPGKYKASITGVFTNLLLWDKEYLWLSLAQSLTNHFKGKLLYDPIVNIDSLSKLIRFLERLPSFGFIIPSTKQRTELLKRINSLDQRYELKDKNNTVDSYLLQLYFRQWEFSGTNQKYKIIITSQAFSPISKIANANENAEKCLRKKYNTSYLQYEAYMFMLYTFFFSNGGFGNFGGHLQSAKNKSEQIAFSNFLDLISVTKGNLRKKSKKEKYNVRKPFYINLSLLQDFPIINAKENHFICPSISYLLNRFAKGTYHDINEFYLENNEGTKEKEEFSRQYGLVLEKISSKFLSDNKGKHRVSEEFIFDSKKKLKSADLHLYYNGNIGIIQIKNKRLTLKSLSGDINAYQVDFQKGIMRGIEQSTKLLNNQLYIEELKNRLNVDRFTKIYYININPEEYVVDHLFQYNKISLNYIKENLKNPEFIGIPYFVINLSLETFFMLIEITNENSISFNVILDQYLSYRNKLELKYDVATDGIPKNFEEFIRDNPYFKKTQFIYSDNIYKSIIENTEEEIQKRFNF